MKSGSKAEGKTEMLRQTVRGFLLCAIVSALLLIPGAARAAESGTYLIQPEDELEVVVWPNEEMTMKITVRPDGKISYPIVGELKVEGMTIDQLQKIITENLSGYVMDPKVAVNVTSFRRARVFVLGEVKKPGVYDMRKGDTVMDALMQAGGATNMGKQSQVGVIRAPETPVSAATETAQIVGDNGSKPPAAGKAHVEIANIADLVGKGTIPSVFFLQDGDIIYVPRGNKVDWDKVTQQLDNIYRTFSILSIDRNL